MTDDEIAEAREREIERILSDDAEIETLLTEAGTPKGIAKFVVWVNRRSHHLALRDDVDPGIRLQWPRRLAELEHAVDRAVVKVVDNRRSDAVRY